MRLPWKWYGTGVTTKPRFFQAISNVTTPFKSVWPEEQRFAELLKKVSEKNPCLEKLILHVAGINASHVCQCNIWLTSMQGLRSWKKEKTCDYCPVHFLALWSQFQKCFIAHLCNCGPFQCSGLIPVLYSSMVSITSPLRPPPAGHRPTPKGGGRSPYRTSILHSSLHWSLHTMTGVSVRINYILSSHFFFTFSCLKSFITRRHWITVIWSKTHVHCCAQACSTVMKNWGIDLQIVILT